MEAITFRAEPEFIELLKSYAGRLGLSANAALKEIVGPVIGFSKRMRKPKAPRNGLSRFRGTLSREDLAPIVAAQSDLSKIDKEMWQ